MVSKGCFREVMVGVFPVGLIDRDDMTEDVL